MAIEIVDFPLKIVIFHCYVSSPEGIRINSNNSQTRKVWPCVADDFSYIENNSSDVGVRGGNIQNYG